MGKWLNLLRQSARSPADPTDETDKTDTSEVSSVLSYRLHGRSKTFAPDKATGSVSFGGSLNEPFPNFRALFGKRSDWNEEDWQVAFHERAAFFEYDQGMPCQEAETLARHQIEIERKRWLQ